MTEPDTSSAPTTAATEASTDSTVISWANCAWVGFDMDHTLVRYCVPALTKLVFDAQLRRLCEKRKFPDALRATEPDFSMFSKGIVFGVPGIALFVVHLYVSQALRLSLLSNLTSTLANFAFNSVFESLAFGCYQRDF